MKEELQKSVEVSVMEKEEEEIEQTSGILVVDTTQLRIYSEAITDS